MHTEQRLLTPDAHRCAVPSRVTLGSSDAPARPAGDEPEQGPRSRGGGIHVGSTNASPEPSTSLLGALAAVGSGRGGNGSTPNTADEAAAQADPAPRKPQAAKERRASAQGEGWGQVGVAGGVRRGSRTRP